MRKLVAVLAGGLLGLGFLALMASPADAELKTSISGSIRLNAHYTSTIATTGAAEEVAPTGLPFTAGPGKSRELDNSELQFDARRTRLQLDMSDTVGNIKLSGRFQGDFDTSDGNANTSNARHFRMRLGWGQWQTPGGWIVRFGQVRSMLSEYGDNLFGGVADADTVDENGEWDQLQARQAGVNVGWTTKMMGGDLLVGVGVENSSTALQTATSVSTAAPIAQGVQTDQPMFGAAARFRTPLFAVFARGAAQQQRVIFTTGAGGNKQGDTTELTGWLGAIGAEVTPGPLRVYGQYYYGDGLNRITGTFNDVSVVAGGCASNPAAGHASGCVAGTGPVQYARHIRSISTHNMHGGAAYKLTKDLKVEAVYQLSVATANRKIFDLSATSVDKRDFQAVHANIIYAFWTRFDTGLEYQWGRVGSFGSSTGIMNAVNWRLRFYF